MYKTLMLLLTVALVSFSAIANEQAKAGKNDDLYLKVKTQVPQFMEQVFGLKPPSMQDYYAFEGPHSEEEYGMEIQECKNRWGNPQNLDDRSYALNLPQGCRDWIVERDSNRGEYISLYYQSIRKQFKKLPLKYQIKATMLTDHGYLVKVSIPDEHKVIVLNVYSLKLAAADPELIIIAIKDILQEVQGQ